MWEKILLEFIYENTSQFSLKIVWPNFMKNFPPWNWPLLFENIFFFPYKSRFFFFVGFFPCKPIIIQSDMDDIVNPVLECVCAYLLRIGLWLTRNPVEITVGTNSYQNSEVRENVLGKRPGLFSWTPDGWGRASWLCSLYWWFIVICSLTALFSSESASLLKLMFPIFNVFGLCSLLLRNQLALLRNQ